MQISAVCALKFLSVFKVCNFVWEANLLLIKHLLLRTALLGELVGKVLNRDSRTHVH